MNTTKESPHEANKKIAEMEDLKVKLSTLWIFVMFNMAFADIIGFINPGALEEIMTMQITQGLIVVFAILTEIPIAMIFLSRVLKYSVNRWANIIAGILTIVWVIGGGNTHLSYIFFATVEVVAMSFIIWYAWTWHNPEGQP